MLRGRAKEYLKGYRRSHGGGSNFPVEKFLRSRVGRPWSEVHSELSQEFDRRTYAGYVFWRHFEGWYVHTNCWIGAETGRVYSNDYFGRASQVDGFYVHPWTGILREQKRVIGPRKVKPITHIPINDRNWLDKIEGIWYWIEQYEVHTEHWTDAKPTWGKHDERVIEGVTFYKIKEVEHIYNKKQLSHEMLQKNKLTNDTPEQIQEDVRIQAEKDKLERETWKRIWAARDERAKAANATNV